MHDPTEKDSMEQESNKVGCVSPPFVVRGVMMSLPVWYHVLSRRDGGLPLGGLPPEGDLPPPGRQTNTSENITFTQLCWRPGIIRASLFYRELNTKQTF